MDSFDYSLLPHVSYPHLRAPKAVVIDLAEAWNFT